MRPSLLNNLASSLVREARGNPYGLGAVNEDQTQLDRSRLDEILNLREFEARVLLDNAVALLLQHNVCFRETTSDGTFLVFPSLITAGQLVLDDEHEWITFATYDVSGGVENVFAYVAVRLGYTNFFTRTGQWQGHARYRTPDGETCGLAATPVADGQLEIALYAEPAVGESTRKLFMAFVEDALAKRPISMEGVLHKPCSRCGGQHDRVAIKKATRGNRVLFCGHGERVDPVILLGAARPDVRTKALDREQDLAEQRTAFEEALVYVKAWRRENHDGLAPTCFVCYARNPETDGQVTQLVTRLREAGINVIWDQDDNAEIGSSVPRFAWTIGDTDSVVIVCTPELAAGIKNAGSTGKVVAYEIDIVSHLLTSSNETMKRKIRPVLLRGESHESLPLALQGRVYADLRDPGRYLVGLLDLILSIHAVEFNDPAIRENRAAVQRLMPVKPVVEIGDM